MFLLDAGSIGIARFRMDFKKNYSALKDTRQRKGQKCPCLPNNYPDMLYRSFLSQDFRILLGIPTFSSLRIVIITKSGALKV